MILRIDNFDKMFEKIIKEKYKVVVYGAGMIGKTILPYWINQYQLEREVLYYVDMDENKWEKNVLIGDSRKRIVSIEELLKEDEKIVLLISNSNFFPIIEMLDLYSELKKVEAYIVPMLLLNNINNVEGEEKRLVTRTDVKIPKKIHYCWFSGNPIPSKLQKCIDSWYKYCPDYEIIRWDESNYDFSWNLYMKQAYEAKKWGFVPDVARLDILYRYGGIYLDTDVELVASLDDLLNQPGFCGVEKWGNVNIGSCAGAIAGHPVIKELLDYRVEEVFLTNDGKYNLETCGYYETIPLVKKGFKVNNTTQCIEGMTIYSSDYFCPFDYMSMQMSITPHTHSIHHFNGGWLDDNASLQRSMTQKRFTSIIERMKLENGI